MPHRQLTTTSADSTRLHEHVDAFTSARNQTERTDAFVELVRWARHGWKASEALPTAAPREPGRLDRLLELLDDPDVRRRFHVAIGALLAEAEATSAFAHAGIPSERGFLAELGERVMNHVLPRPRNDQDLGHLLRRLFRDAADAEQLARMPDDRLVRLRDALIPDNQPHAREAVRRSFANGFRLLSLSVQAHGLSPKLRKRSRSCDLTESPFYQIPRLSEGRLAGGVRVLP